MKQEEMKHISTALCNNVTVTSLNVHHTHKVGHFLSGPCLLQNSVAQSTTILQIFSVTKHNSEFDALIDEKIAHVQYM